MRLSTIHEIFAIFNSNFYVCLRVYFDAVFMLVDHIWFYIIWRLQMLCKYCLQVLIYVCVKSKNVTDSN
jgi:hypothetical protein